MGKLKSVKGAKENADDAVFNMDKFLGEGVMFKCKLFGCLRVEAPRGDDICAEAINKLKQQAKQLNKESKVHKQRIFLNISLKGIRIIDEKTKKLEHAHVVHKVSYISHDKDDRRTFGYIFSQQDGYNLFAFRTEKNAGNVTASLKELFHVVFLKHKQEKGNPQKNNAEGQIENQATEIEAGVEEKEEDPYAVPSKFQLVQKIEEDLPDHYAIPSSQPADGVEQPQSEHVETVQEDSNLLDWADVNEELEYLSKDMKRSNTTQLLAELGDLNMDVNPPQLAEKAGVFGDDPFFGSSLSSPTADQGGMKSSSSNPDLLQARNPFNSGGNMQGSGSNLSVNKSRSIDCGLFESNDMFSSTAQDTHPASNTTTLVSQVGDLFSSVTSNPPQPASAWSTPFNPQADNNWGMSGAGNGFDSFNANQPQASLLAPTMNENSLFSPPDAEPQLVPEKIADSTAKNDDPFAALAGGIKDIRGQLPVATGDGMPQFPKKNKPTPTSPIASPRVISQGPTMLPNQSQQHPMSQQQPYQQSAQGAYGQSNPFNQPSMPYTAGYASTAGPPSIPARPDIPARVDLTAPAASFQGMPPMQQSFSPPMRNPYGQTPNNSFQNQGMNAQNPAAADPFSGLGNAFSLGNATPASEPLYATVDKSKKSSNISSQSGTDMFSMFDSAPVSNTANTNTDLLDGAFVGGNSAASNAAKENPFGDSFGGF